jgi:hypothetical protein
MIEADKVDLRLIFEIQISQSDCTLDFPGYSVDTARSDSDILLVKLPSPKQVNSRKYWVSFALFLHRDFEHDVQCAIVLPIVPLVLNL